MTRRKATAPAFVPEDWIVHTDAFLHNRNVAPGTELSIKGERGRFRFVKLVERPQRGIAWIDVWGGPKAAPHLRSFRPEQIRSVHRINTDPKALLAARKEAKAA